MHSYTWIFLREKGIKNRWYIKKGNFVVTTIYLIFFWWGEEKGRKNEDRGGNSFVITFFFKSIKFTGFCIYRNCGGWIELHFTYSMHKVKPSKYSLSIPYFKYSRE